MTISSATITQLKTLGPEARLRFVEEKIAFYWRDLDATDTADNDDVILPNDNIGRWFKNTGKYTPKSEVDAFASAQITTRNKPPTLDSPQNGIFDFIGRNYSTSGNWSNPYSSGRVAFSRYKDFSGSSPVFLTDKILTGLAGNTTFSLAGEQFSGYNSGQIESGFFHIGFRDPNGYISQVKLQSMFWANASPNVSGANLGGVPGSLDIFGTNDPSIQSVIAYGSQQSSTGNQYRLMEMFLKLKVEHIGYINLNSANDWPSNANGTSYRNRFIEVNAQSFYTDLILISNRGHVSSTFPNLGNYPSFYFVNELELYGDIRTIPSSQ